MWALVWVLLTGVTSYPQLLWHMTSLNDPGPSLIFSSGPAPITSSGYLTISPTTSSTVSVDPSVQIGAPLTISLRVYASSISPGATLFDFGNGLYQKSIYARAGNNSDLVLGFWNSATSGVETVCPNQTSISQWTTYTISMGMDGKGVLYQDGLVACTFNTPAVPQISARSKQYIGHSITGQPGWNGYIDFMWVLPRVVGMDEALSLYAMTEKQGSGWFFTSPTSLSAGVSLVGSPKVQGGLILSNNPAQYAVVAPGIVTGGDSTMHIRLQKNSLTGWSHVVDFADGSKQNTIEIRQGSGDSLEIDTSKSSSAVTTLNCADYWGQFLGQPLDVVVVFNDTDVIAYRNGNNMCSASSRQIDMLPLALMARAQQFIGTSAVDYGLDGAIYSVTYWSTPLSASSVAQVSADLLLLQATATNCFSSSSSGCLFFSFSDSTNPANVPVQLSNAPIQSQSLSLSGSDTSFAQATTGVLAGGDFLITGRVLLSSSGPRDLLFFANDNNNTFRLGVASDNSLFVESQDPSDNTTVAITVGCRGKAFPLQTWAQFSVLIQDGVATIYTNDVQVCQGQFVESVFESRSEFWIGKGWNGLIDYLYIFPLVAPYTMPPYMALLLDSLSITCRGVPPGSAISTCSENSFLGTTCTDLCPAGAVSLTPSTGRCTLGAETSAWTSHSTTCAVPCTAPSKPQNGTVTCRAGPYGANMWQGQCNFTCSTGFVMVGNAGSVCNLTGSYVPPAPVCQAVACPYLNATQFPYTQSITCSGPVGPNYFNANCSIKCVTNAVGPTSVTCGSNGQWSTTPQCAPIKCPDLPALAPSAGVITCSNGFGSQTETINSLCNYTCFGDYLLIGAASRTCQAPGVWSQGAADCQVKNCGPIVDSNIANGHVVCDNGLYGQYLAGSLCTYTCNSGYTLSGASTRLCGLNGWNGTDPVCVDVNECLQSICDGRANCLNYNGGYACSPYINSSIVSSITGTSVMNSTMGETVYATFAPGVGTSGPFSPIIRSSTGVFFPCQSSTIVGSTVSCFVPYGLGPSQFIQLSYTVNFNSQTSTVLSNSQFGYPTPVINTKSLRFYPAGVGNTSLTASNIADGESIMFNGKYFLANQSVMSVTFGPPENPALFTCALNEAASSSTTIVCRTQGRAGGINKFTIYANGVSVTGSDTYQFPSVPFISSVSSPGCNSTNQQVTNCPTAGNVPLTVRGLFWDDTVKNTILIGTDVCTNLTTVTCVSNNCTLVVSLPPGTGLNQAIVIDVGEKKYSDPRRIVSYSIPSISTISSPFCTQGSPLSLVQCPRAGGILITIQGQNFGRAVPGGATGAQVMIGSAFCTDVTHDSTTPDQRLTCTIPSGFDLNTPVQLFQANGPLSKEQVTIGYTECTPGTIQADSTTMCYNCLPGSYSALPGSTQCLPCQLGTVVKGLATSSCSQCKPGSYQNSTGQSECMLCAPGFYSSIDGAATCTQCRSGFAAAGSGTSTCTACLPGSFSLSGQPTCTACQQGKYADVSGQLECFDCPSGKYSSDVGFSVCTDCLAGYQQPSQGQSNCSLCPLGTYASSSGTQQCAPCPSGTTSTSPGAQSCQECPAGTISQSSVAQPPVNCQPCGPGLYIDVNGQNLCLDCPPGRASNQTGVTTCIDCQPGYYTSASAYGSLHCSPCPQGKFADAPGLSECSPCPAGRSASKLGQATCDSCLSGYFAPDSSDPTCYPCIEGEYIDLDGQATCVGCPQGTYAPYPGTTNCENCPPGTFQDFPGALICKQCPPGTYADGSGREKCLGCPEGKFAGGFNSTECTGCPEGRFQSGNDPTQCQACPLGMANPSPGRVECNPCLSGQFANQTGLSSCFPCNSGTYQPQGASVTCALCPVGKTSDPGSDKCTQCGVNLVATVEGTPACYRCENGQPSADQDMCICSQGYYLPSITEACRECPSGAICLSGTTMDNMGTQDNYWRTSNQSLDFLRCLNVNSCRGGKCVYPTTGTLCALCAKGYSQTFDRSCEICKTSSSNANIVVAVFLTTLVAMGVVVWLVFANRVLPGASSRKLAEFLSHKNDISHSVELMYSLKLLLRFFQITSTIAFLPLVQQLQVPAVFIKFLNLFQFVMMDVVPWHSVACLNPERVFFSRLLIICLLPIFLVLLLHTLLYAVWLVRRGSMPSQIAKYLAVRLLLLTTFALYPSVCSMILSTFACTKIGGVWYLNADYSVHCFTSAWYKWAYFAIVMMVVYPLGVPFMYFMLLWKNRKRLSTPFGIVGLGFLHESYERDRWWYELVPMLEKLILCSLVQFLPNFYQLPAAMVVLYVFLAFAIYVHPETSTRNWCMNIMSSAEILMLFMYWQLATAIGDAIYQYDTVYAALFIVLLVGFLGLLFLNTQRIVESINALKSENRLVALLQKLVGKQQPIDTNFFPL